MRSTAPPPGVLLELVAGLLAAACVPQLQAAVASSGASGASSGSTTARAGAPTPRVPVTSRPPASSLSCATVQSRLNAAIASGDAHFQLPAGGIACPVDFQVFGARDLTVSGARDGSTEFWFDPHIAGFVVRDSSNVTVRRLAVDHDPLPYIQAEITAMTAASYTFELGVRSLPFEMLNGSLGTMTQPWLWGGIGADRWVKGHAPGIPLSKLAKLAGGTYRTTPGFPNITGAQVGDAITVMLRQYHTWTIGNSSRCTVEDVTIYSSKGLNFYELDGEGGHTYRRIKNARRDGQLISSNADAFHSIDVAVGPLLEDSELAYCLDDFFNIHNTIHIALPSPAAASSTPTGNDGAPGDGGGGGEAKNDRMTLVNPRIGVGSHTPTDGNETARTLDEWYGDTSPMTNVRAGEDTILCRTFNTFIERLGGSVVVLKKTLVTDPARTSVAAKTALISKLSAQTHVRFMAVDKIEVWDIELPAGSLSGWNVSAEAGLMCDIERFLARGSIIRNNTFHHTTCNLGRTKSSDSMIENNTWGTPTHSESSSNLEVTGLENWMEGPMLIDNVSVVNNVFLGAADGNRNVHPSPQATNVSVHGNLPHKPAPPPPPPPGPVQPEIRVPLFAARTLHATGQSRVTLSLQ